MASTRTPTSSTIRMSDLDKSITQGWTTDTANQSLGSYRTSDFNPGAPPYGFAYCYGNSGSNLPSRITYHYDLLGWVDYTSTAVNVNNVADIFVDFNPMNGSNGTAPTQAHLSTGGGGGLPNGSFAYEGAHWETIQFVVQVNGMAGGSFDVYFDGTYIDTIISDGVYVYDNGGLGYTNGYAPSGIVEVRFQ
jgi:hypothetical protein